MEDFGADFQVMVARRARVDVTHITHDRRRAMCRRMCASHHRTARHKAEGDAFILVSPDEEIVVANERHIGQLSRVTCRFDYRQAPALSRSQQQTRRRRTPCREA
jgi:hypothetical protein